MRYTATIKWLDDQEIQDDMIFKIGDIWNIDEDDDDVFCYLQDESEIDEFKKEGVNDFIILNINKQN